MKRPISGNVKIHVIQIGKFIKFPFYYYFKQKFYLSFLESLSTRRANGTTKMILKT